jgi:hypothetical protein
MPRSLRILGAVAALAALACASAGDRGHASVSVRSQGDQRAAARRPPPVRTGYLIAAGDIACRPRESVTRTSCHHARTASMFGVGGRLHRRRLRGFLLLGDTQYELGRTYEYASFDRTWGRAMAATPKAKILPSPGNHEYGNPDPVPGWCRLTDPIHHACGYEGYFGSAALPRGGDGQGDYARIIGADRRHPLVVIVLNVGRCEWDHAACRRAGPPARFLRKVLANPKRNPPEACTVVAWHQARWSDFGHGDLPWVTPIWRSLFRQTGATRPDLVLNGHDHLYARFPKLSIRGRFSGTGIPEVISGAGGKEVAGIPFAGDPPGLTSFVDLARFGVVRLGWNGSQGSLDTAFMTIGGARVDPKTYPCRA